jgi:signal transduction histidine kinase
MNAPQPRPTVLVVDDEKRNRTLVSAILEPRHRVLEAESAAQAEVVLASEAVDLVLLDLMMPGTSGLDYCRALKQRPRADFLPVVLLTALSDQEQRNAGLEAGADDYVSKPFDRRDLVLRVTSLLRRRSQELELREQKELIAAQLEELAHVTELKDDLVTLLVHDLRNPLAGISGLLEALGNEMGESAHREDVEGALRSATQMRAILDDMLEVRQLEEDQLVVRLEREAVLPMVSDALVAVGGSAREHGVNVVSSGDALVFARLDRRLLSRALWNLAVNAIRYSPKGGVVEVVVNAHEGFAEIDVGDRGPGVPHSVRGHLFEKFRSSEGARRGFGLGLYMVKLVATAHGGRVAALDREGGGALLRISLPLALAG